MPRDSPGRVPKIVHLNAFVRPPRWVWSASVCLRIRNVRRSHSSGSDRSAISLRSQYIALRLFFQKALHQPADRRRYVGECVAPFYCSLFNGKFKETLSDVSELVTILFLFLILFSLFSVRSFFACGFPMEIRNTECTATVRG